ncbi:MAG TPA: PD-(D/E)XK nuclease family transposase [Candidatus Mediterraneibacter caccogallinarum]|nr:PD-(D/E)XK nuclease family transposase [Candidatus Mediterraneibacter caccogallinarum]
MDKRNSENFIMLPTVDFCFKELMQNPKVRQGFIAAIMGKDPKTIRKTTLIPNATKKESKDAKLGILDVMVEMEDGSKVNMELHILELKKLPPGDQNEEGVIRWMRFFVGKNRKEFEDMAKTDEYIEEAYDELKKLSMDEQKRMEYEARQKAIRDYNSQMKSAREYGLKLGREEGIEQGREQGIKQGMAQGERSALQKLIRKKKKKGMSLAMIAELLEMDPKEVAELDKEAPEEE